MLRQIQYLAGTIRYRARTLTLESKCRDLLTRRHSGYTAERTSAQQQLVQLYRIGQSWHRICMLLCPTHTPPARAWACLSGNYTRKEKVCVSLNSAWLQSYHQAQEWCKLPSSSVCGFCGKVGAEVLLLKQGIVHRDLPNPARRGTRPCCLNWLLSKCHACRLTVQPYWANAVIATAAT